MRFRAAVIAASLLAGGAAAVAEPLVFSSPRPGELLRAGSEIDVRWTGVPAGAEEMELLLSLDGGQRIAVRLTSEMPGEARSFSWRVPNLVSSSASLVLRVGSLGRESVIGTSAAFAIAPERSIAFERVVSRNGELWLTSDAAPSDPLSPAGMNSPDRGWTVSEASGKAVSLSSSNLLPLPSRARFLHPGSTPPPQTASRRAAANRIPPPSPALRL